MAEGKKILQILGRSHMPYPVGRRIASLIPPAHIEALVLYVGVLVASEKEEEKEEEEEPNWDVDKTPLWEASWGLFGGLSAAS